MIFDDKIRVLMVDDMPPICLLVKKILIRMGLSKIDVSHNGGDAWLKIEQAHLEGRPYDILLCDWNMPESGLDLLKKIRASGVEGICELPFIMITCEVFEDQVKLAFDEGASNYIAKPFEYETIEKKVKETLEKYHKI
jgi:two-component system chemotaxis response regulator CheY